MKFNWKRMLALVMALTLIVGMIPRNAQHAHAEETEEPEVEAQASTTLPKGQSPEQVAGDGLTWIMDGDYFADCGKNSHTHTDECLTCDHKDGHQSTCYGTEYAVCPDKDNHAHTGTANITDVFTIEGNNVEWVTSHPAYLAVYAIYKEAYDKAYASAWFAKDTAGKIAGVAAIAGVTVCFTSDTDVEPVCNHVHTDACYDGSLLGWSCPGYEHAHVDPDCYFANWKEVADINNNEVDDTLDPSYTVKYMDGETELASHTVLVGLATPAAPSVSDREYYTFAGWGEVAEKVTADAVYTAQWTINNDKNGNDTPDETEAHYTVTFVVDGETYALEENVLVNLAINAPANPVLEGYGFDAWLDANGAAVSFPYTVTGDITLTAKFSNRAARIGEVYYESLLEAIAAAQPGETVVMLKDATLGKYVEKATDAAITINKAITLDGNGYTLTSKAGRAINVDVDGQVEIKNLTIKQYAGRNGNDQKRCINVIGQPVELKITNCKLELVEHTANNRKLASYTAGVNISNTATGAKVVIDGCQISVIYAVQTAAVSDVTIKNTTIDKALYGVNVQAAATVKLENSILNGNPAFGANNRNISILVQTSGATITADANTVINAVSPSGGPASIVYSTVENVVLNIDLSAATLNKVNASDPLIFLANAEAQIFNANGTVMYDTLAEAIATGAGEVEILAEALQTEEAVAATNDDYKFVEKDGKFYAVLKDYVAEVNGKGYTSLQKAVNAAEDGAAVRLLVNITEKTEIVVDKTVTLELNVCSVEADLTVKGNGTVVITSGVVNGAISVEENAKLVIYGGWFKVEPKAEWAAAGYVVVYNETEAMWTVENHDTVNGNGVKDEDETMTVTIIGNGTVNGYTETFSVVYDSTKADTFAINAVPVIENGTSKSFVSSITTNGEELPLSYVDYCVTLDAPVAGNNIAVTFTDCGFEYDEDGEMFFYVGIETPKYETLYNAVIASPEYNAEFVESVKYLARSAATYQMQVPVIFEYTIPIINYDIKIGGNTVEIDLDDAWLDVGESFKTLTPEELQKKYDTEIQKIKDEIANIDLSDITWSNALEKLNQFNAISDELTALIETISNEAEYLGYHAFGASGVIDENGNAQEILQVIYNNGAMRLVDETIVVTLVDDRIETTITGGNLTFEYDEFTDEDIMNALVLTDVDGNVIEGALIKHVDLVGTEVGERTYSVYFEGNREYKPATVEFTLTVVKAPSNVEIPNVNVNYGEAYNGEPVVTNKHGEVIDIDTIEFIVGLNIAEFDYDGDGVKGLEGKAQLILTDDLQTILAMVGLEEGVEMNINDLISTLTNTGLLEQWGVSGDMVEALKQALDAINEYVEANNLMISVGGEYPTEAGAYLHGAVTVDKNYETAFGVGYIVIAPAMKQVYLNWNYTDSNGVFSWELLKHVDLGATAYNDAAFTSVNETATNSIHNLFFGIDENGELVFAIQGKGADQKDIEALEATLSNGAYTQLAFTLDLGNELIYAVPAVRAFVIVPGVTNVELVDAEGNALDEFKFTYDNTAKQLYVMVDGELVDCDVYYAGVKTNVNVYEPTTEAPVNAGAYAAVAIYIARNENGEIIGVGGDAAVMYIDLTESAISVTGSTVTYDGNGHTADVVITEGYANADYTLISGNVAFNGSMLDIDVDDIVGTVNIDFPRWLEEKLAGNEFVNGINPAYLTALIKSHSDVIGEYVDVDTLLSIVDKLSENVTITFENGITYTDVGHYYYVGIVTDSDHYPSVDTGLLVIEKADATVTMNDLTMHIGQEMPELTWIVDGMAEGDEFTVVISHNVDVNVAGEYVITATVTDDNYNIVVVDGILTVEPHEAGETVVENEKAPTCTETGSYDNVVYCTVCGEELSRETIPVDALGHTKETIPAVEPTFDNVGWTEGEKCSVCGETLVAPVEIPKKIAVAQNKETGVRYETLAEAIAEVKNGQTIVILAEELDEDVTIAQKKNLAFTIDGAGVQYTGTITVTGSASTAGLTVQNVNFIVDGYGIYSYEKKVAYNITVDDCTFTGTDGENLDYGMYLRYVNNVTVKDTTGSNLFDLVYGNSSFTGFTAENVTVTDSYNGIWLSYPIGTINFTNVTISRTENTGVGFHNYAKGTVTFTGCEIDKISYGEKGDKALTMIFNDKVNNLAADQDSQYLTIVLNNVDTTVTAIEGLNAVSGVDGYIVVHENGVYYLAKPVAQNVQTGKMYAELSKAIAEVENGETIIMLVDIDEDVTIKQAKNVAFTIDGGNHKYYGTMTLTGAGASNVGQALTIQNVNFVVDGYGIYAYAKNNYTRNLTVDGCTFTGVDGGDLDYGIYMRYVYSVTVKNTTGSNLFDLVYGNSAVNGFTAENVTVTDSENGIMLGYVNTTATFKNVTTDVRDDGVIIRNNTSGSVYFEDCNIDNVCYWQINDTKTLKMYFNDATNNLVISEGYEKLTVVLNKVDTTVTCETVGLNVVPGAGLEQYKVRYENGVYFLVAIEYVAEVNGVQYESIQDAVNAANDGDTVTVIADHEVDCDVNPLINISGKAVTIDLNGKIVTANVTDDSVRIVFNVEADGKLTMVDNVGTGSVVANGDGILHYMFRSFGEFSVESGNYVLSGLNGGAMFYSDNSDFTVNGGNFTQLTGGWMFNTTGNGAGNIITVEGGTFNRYFIGGEAMGENKWGEVVLGEGKHLTDNGDGTWTVEVHKVVTQDGYPATCTTDGLTEGKYCEGCGEVLVEQTVIKSEGHKADVPVKENEVAPVDGKLGSYDMVVYCSVCGEELSRESFKDYGDYVCYNVNTEVYYEDLSDALAMVSDANGETIRMLADVTEMAVIVYPGTTLDLNGKTVTATFVVALNGSHVIDATRTGTLVVSQNNIELAKDNKMLPVWNGTGYTFTEVVIVDAAQGMGITWNEETDKVTLKFVTFFRDTAMLAGKISDHDVKIIVRASWTNETGTVDQDFVFSDEHVSEIIAKNGKSAFVLTFNNYSQVSKLKLTAMIITDSGVEYAGTLYEQK